MLRNCDTGSKQNKENPLFTTKVIADVVNSPETISTILC